MPIRSPHDRTRTGGRRSPALVRLRVVALVAAVLLPLLLVLHGTVLEAATTSPLALMALMTLVPVVIAVAAAAPPRRALSYALVPITGGLLSITVAVGATVFPGEADWWVPGSVVSALPLLVLAVVSAPPGR